MGYTGEAIRGVTWVGAFRLTSRGLSLGRTVVLARLLTPAQFGTFGIAFLVMGLIDTLTETGINTVLIQAKDKFEEYIDTAWVISIARGILIALLIIASAQFVAAFFSSPEAYNLLLLTSIVPFIRGFINPAIITFQKNLAFNKEFWFRFGIFFVESLVMITLALITRSAASAVFGLIASSAVEVIASFLFISPKPRLQIAREKFNYIISNGKWMTLASIFNYLFYNIDNIVVGRILGVTALGFYQMGYRIATLPVTEVLDAVSKVTFPVYLRIAAEKERLRAAFFKTVLAITLIALPFGFLLLLFPQQLVLFFLGSDWLPIVPILQILAIFGVIRTISSLVYSLFLSVHKQKYVSIVTLSGLVGLLIALFPLVNAYGIVGAAIAALIGSLVPIPVMLYLSWRVLK